MSADKCTADDLQTWLFEQVKPIVDDEIGLSLQEEQYQDQLWYQVSTGGKRLRPGITMICGKLCEADRDRILKTAAGVELLHTFSLIHDDLIDDDRVRRNDPAFWVEYGRPDAVNIGDMSLAHALSAIPDEGKPLAINKVKQMTVGQQMDFDFTSRRDLTESDYIEMVSKKTGALFDLCLEIPQVISETDLKINGYTSLWPAFQIRDDLLDFDERKSQDVIGSDVKAGKRTLLAVHADSDYVYQVLDKPPEETTTNDIKNVQRVYSETGSFEYAHKRMNALANNALAALDTLPDSADQQRLAALSQYFVDRNI